MLGSIAIVGAGSIGTSWAIVFARGGHPVAVYDPDPARLAAAGEEIAARLAALEAAALLAESGTEIAARVSTHDQLGPALEGAVHIQECAPEQLELKRELFNELDTLADPDAVIASSSSALTISETAGHLPGRGRCLVVHPANPPHLLPVVELVPAAFTDPAVTERTFALLKASGMSPVHVRHEIEGFVYNRLQGAVLREAYCLVRDGVISVDDIDRVMREGLGRRWAVIGPFETADLNTRGGIAEHARKMGPAYARMGAERGQHDPWDDELVAAVTEQRRALLPLSDWERRIDWRDRALIAQERARRLFDSQAVDHSQPAWQSARAAQ
ncbi:MAG TPA: 3-hydroxyacyl-CoA dehydrogenase [Solirubrobacteraceae bacterium]|nr:3-hydroxyacyl-CoA dehydrogenase [Solirubrobacteraceae bacterium]